MRRTLQQVILFVLGAVFVSAGAACADTHWVNLAGSNQPPFTSYAEGAHSIQDAVDQSVAGDTVRIAAGVHRPDTTIFLKDSIAVIGAGRDSTVIMPGKETGWYDIPPIFRLEGPSGGAGGGLTLKGCSIRGLRSQIKDSPDRLGVHLSLKTTTTNYITDNEFWYCREGISAGYANLVAADNFFDSNDVAIAIRFGGPFDIHHNTIIGRPLPGGAVCGWGIDGGSWPLVGPARIHHNMIFTCDGAGIGAKGVSDSILIYNNLIVTGGVYMGLWTYCDCRGAIIRNNTVVRTDFNSYWPVVGVTAESGHEIVLENNAFQSVRGILQFWHGYGTGGTIRFAYNDLWGLDSGTSGIRGVEYETGLTVDTAHNLYRAPMFTSDSTYRLQRGSPLIDTGNPLLLDLDGSRSDIGWAGGPDGMTYTYPEEPPQRPDTLIGQVSDQIVHLNWPRNTEADLAKYRAYRDTYSSFSPSPGNLLTEIVDDTSYADLVNVISGDLFYLLTAMDTTGLESPPSNEVARFPTGILQEEEGDTITSPDSFTLAVYPNPSNSSVVIEFVGGPASPMDEPVRVSIFNILGNRFQDLTPTYQGSRKWTAFWNGTDRDGKNMTSGLYFVRVSWQGKHMVRKICLIK